MVDECLDVIVVEWKFVVVKADEGFAVEDAGVVEWKFVVVNADEGFAVEDAGVVEWKPVVYLVNTDGIFADD